MTIIKITFEDHGQEFLEWVIRMDTGAVISCTPFQQWVWVGKLVDRSQTFSVGNKVRLCGGGEILYPIVSAQFVVLTNEEFVKWSCKDCDKLCIIDNKDYYSVKKEVWEQHGVGKGMLCMDCMEVRLGRKLTEVDIHRCQLTEFDNPYTAAILKQSINDKGGTA
jgi:hypothetical protein